MKATRQRKCQQGTCQNQAVWYVGRLDLEQPTTPFYLCHKHFWQENERFTKVIETTQELLQPDGDHEIESERSEG